MSKLIATRAIRGAHSLVGRAEEALAKALEDKGADTKVEFPNTGYYLPISHGMLGLSIDKLGGLNELLEEAKRLGATGASFDHMQALALAELGDLSEAVASLERAIDLEPSSAQIHHHFGMLLLALGDFHECPSLVRGNARAKKQQVWVLAI